MSQASYTFLPVILPNYNVGGPMGVEAPGLGHAGFIVVGNDGKGTFYEFGRYDPVKNVNTITNNPLGSTEGNIRQLNILTPFRFDANGNIDQTSLMSALNEVFGSSNMYSSDTGMVSITQFGMSKGQLESIQGYIKNQVKLITDGQTNYAVLGKNCLQFVYDAASAANLSISPSQNLPGPAVPSMAFSTIREQGKVTFQYFGPNSWNQNWLKADDSLLGLSADYLADRLRQFAAGVTKTLANYGIVGGQIQTRIETDPQTGNPVSIELKDATTGRLLQRASLESNGSLKSVIFNELGQKTRDILLDPDGLGGSRSTFDPSNGRIQSTQIDRSDGSSIERLYDASARLTSETTFLSDRTARQTLYDHENKQSWSEATTRYDVNGRAIAQNVRNDNGTRYEAVVDAATGRYTQRTDFNVSGQKTATTAFGSDGGIRSKTTFDATGQQAWKEITHGYNSGGGITSESRLNRDGTRSEAVVDPATGSFTQRSDFNTVGQKTATTLFRADGTTAKTFFDVTGSQTWKEATVDYNRAGQPVGEQRLNRDGTRSVAIVDPASGQFTQRIDYSQTGTRLATTIFDVAGSQAWKVLVQGHNEAGGIISQKIVYDDGTAYEAIVNPSTNRFTERTDYNSAGVRTATFSFRNDGSVQSKTTYDALGVQPWTQVTHTYNNSGGITKEQRLNRDGTRSDAVVDPATNRFTQRTDYNQLGQKIEVTDFNLDGTSRKTLYDVDNSHGWREVKIDYDAQGKPTREAGLHDNGTRYEADVNPSTGRFTNKYDFDSTGRKTATTNFRDDGTRRVTYHDLKNSGSWTEAAVEYNRQGQAVSETGTNRYGDRYEALLDPVTGKFTERSDYNAAGQKLSAITYRADGSGQKTLYDIAGNQPWSEVTTLLDKNGKPTAEWGRNDDGTHFDAIVNPNTGKYLVRNDYNKFGQKEVSTTFRDDGSQVKVFSDPANTKPYTEVVIEYDKYGRPVAEAGKLDNGNQYQATYQFGYLSEEMIVVAADGQVINNKHSAGSLISTVYRDNQNKYGWTSKKATYGSNGWTSSEITIMDDGKVYSVYYNRDGSFKNGYVQLPAGGTYSLNNNGGQLTYTIPSQGSSGGSSGGFGAALGSFAMGLVPSYGGTTITLNGSGSGSTSGGGGSTTGGSYSGGSTGGGTGGYDPNFGLAPVGSWNTGSGTGNGGGGPTVITITQGTIVPPVVLDLNGDGKLDIRPLGQNAVTGTDVSFDWDGDGKADRTAWVGPEDGLLVIDLAADGTAGGDGRIDQAREVAFALWKTEDERQAELRQKGIDDTGRPVTDLEGLRYAFDTNGNNTLDHQDARWNEFRVWQDFNQNGIADDGELRTLNEAGIRLIELMPSYNGAKSFHDGSAITGTSKALKADGTTMLVGDVTLSYRPAVSL